MTLGLCRQNIPKVLPQIRELKLAVAQQSCANGCEVVIHEPRGGVFGAVELIDPLPARERNDAIGQGQARMLGSAGGRWQWDLHHALTVSVAL